MPKYTEGERNLQHYLRYGTFPAPPRQYRKQQMGNDISEIVGTHYEGERKPRQIQKLPLYNYYHSQRFAPTAIDIPTPFGQADGNSSDTTRLLMIGGLALGLLILFGIVSF